jgi:hypothetical protein
MKDALDHHPLLSFVSKTPRNSLAIREKAD